MPNWIDRLYRAALAATAQLLPKRPPGSKACSLCQGTGYIRRDATGRGIVCPECRGLGWKPL